MIVVLVLLFIYLMSEKNRVMNFTDLIVKPVPMLVFFVLYGLVYPLVSFINKKVILEKSYSEAKINIIDIFEKTGYRLESESGNILILRLVNNWARVTRLFWEDRISVEYSSETNSVSLSGYRKDVYRLAKHIEYITRTEQTN
jgi:hypothetical protein